MLNENEKGRTMLRKLFSVLAVTALMNSLPLAVAKEVPPRATVVGRELVYPDGVMVSLDAGTGLSSDQLTRLSSQDANLDSVPRATVIKCSIGYTCLYEHANYGGRRLQWRDRNQSINLVNYGFNDKMSSWRNQNTVGARWYYHVLGRAQGFGTSRCMNASPSNRSYVGDSDNDQASLLQVYGSSDCGS